MRFSTSYKLAGPKTMRRGSTKILGKWGGNSQNFEKSIREIIEPDGFSNSIDLYKKCLYWIETGDTSVFTEQELAELKVLIQVDQSGAEALIVAYDSEPLDYRKLFIHGVSPHVYTALKLFKDKWVDESKHSSLTITEDDIETLFMTKIECLKQNPSWKDLSTLIKSSDEWPAEKRYYYNAKQTNHCVDDKTEVLTRDGWTYVTHKPEEIAVYDNGNISFDKPSKWYEGKYSGSMHHIHGSQVDQHVTTNHKVLHYSNKKERVDSAYHISNMREARIPNAGIYIGGSINEQTWLIKLLVAIQADGSFYLTDSVKFHLVKERKMDRLYSILKEGGLIWEETLSGMTTGGNPSYNIYIRNIPHVLKYFKGNKIWDSWLLDFSADNLKVLVDELKYWDGHHEERYLHKRTEYFSKHKQNVNWIKTICHLTLQQATLAQGTDGIWTAGLNKRKMSRARTFTHEVNDITVYCPTVSTGFFLIRRNGLISITGNSGNYGVEWNTFIGNVLLKSEGAIVLSKEQGVYFLQTYRSIFPEIVDRCDRVMRQAKETRILYNMLGFPYQIAGYELPKRNELVAWGPQSTVGEITRIAFTNLQGYIERSNKNWDILQDNHDSYLCQVPLLEVKEGIQKMQEFINIPLVSPIDGAKFSMKSEYGCGFNWSSRKEKNKLGLGELKWI